MTKTLQDLKDEIVLGNDDAKKARELYELLSTYNAYSLLFLKAKQEYEKTAISNPRYIQADCFEKQIKNLFTSFKKNECLTFEQLCTSDNSKDKLFLLDNDTLLRISSSTNNNGYTSSMYYQISKINDCTAKAYKEVVFYSDPYYYESYYSKKDALGWFCDNTLITPSYKFDDNSKRFIDRDIRDVLKVQSIDDIHDRLTESKNNKIKKLNLFK